MMKNDNFEKRLRVHTGGRQWLQALAAIIHHRQGRAIHILTNSGCETVIWQIGVYLGLLYSLSLSNFRSQGELGRGGRLTSQ